MNQKYELNFIISENYLLFFTFGAEINHYLLKFNFNFELQCTSESWLPSRLCAWGKVILQKITLQVAIITIFTQIVPHPQIVR